MAGEGGTGGGTSGAHPDAALVDIFRSMRQDARSQPQAAELARPFVISMTFDGAGFVPTVGQCLVMPLGMITGRITNAVIAANGVGSATIDLRLGTLADLPSLATIYGANTNIPTLTAAATATLNITSWTLNLHPLDVLVATLASVSSVSNTTGILTSLTLSIYGRHLKWPAGSSIVTDTSGNQIVDSSGNVVTSRN